MKYTPTSCTPTPADSFRIITVGTGAPPLDINRVSPCTLIQYKDKYFPVDLGYGSVRKIFEMGILPATITNALITHMHTDHTLDYGIFLMGGWPQGRRRLHTIGPKGVQEMYQHYVDMFKDDISYRKGLGNSLDGITGNMEFTTVAGGESFELDGVKISTLHVPHTAYNVAYKFEADGKCIVVTGDMTYCEAFIDFAKGADFAVMDANMAPSNFPDNSNPAFLSKILKSHATIEQVGEMAEAAGIKTVVLTHFTPDLYVGEAVKAISKVYHGEVIVGYDLMSIEA